MIDELKRLEAEIEWKTEPRYSGDKSYYAVFPEEIEWDQWKLQQLSINIAKANIHSFDTSSLSQECLKKKSSMNLYKVTFKEKEGESYWNNKPLLIVAADYGAAQDKALTFAGRHRGELVSIVLFGETTRSTDVFELRER